MVGTIKLSFPFPINYLVFTSVSLESEPIKNLEYLFNFFA